MSDGRFLISHRNVVCVARKILKLKSLLLEGFEFDDTFKTNNSSSKEANDLLSLLERTIDLRFVQLSPNLEMYHTTSLDMLLSRQPNIAKNAAPTVLESSASAPAHGDSYVNLLSRGGLKHPS